MDHIIWLDFYKDRIGHEIRSGHAAMISHLYVRLMVDALF